MLLHLPSGEEFLLEAADEFDRVVSVLGRIDKFISFLEARAKEKVVTPLREVSRKHGV